MIFFFDRCTSPRIARMVHAFEAIHSTRHHDDDARFSKSTPDIEWIAAIGAEDPPWAVVSGDARILKNKHELAALRATRLKYFCLSAQWMRMQIHEQAWRFMKVWPQIVENALTSRVSLFEVRGGKALKVDPIRF
jgi:PIN like domain